MTGARLVRRELSIELATNRAGQQVGAVDDVRAERWDVDRERRRCEQGEREETERRPPAGADQNCTSGGFSAPPVASNVGFTSASTRYRAVRFVGN